jgi:ABC-type Mn2+/Zn2+ transport system ATPase subunit
MLGKGGKVARTNYETARSLLDWMGVSPDGLKRRAEVLSGGEAGIIALVGSLLSPAKILLLDEPFESFSSQASNRATDLLKVVTSKGKAIIASSHDFRLMGMAQTSQVLDLSKEATITGKRVGQPIS